MNISVLERTVIFAVIMLISFPVHECAHAFAAYKMGDSTAREQGRLTLNPLKHLDLFGTILMLFAGFGWAKPVPINPRNFRNPKLGFAVSSLAGPLSNILLAYIFMVLFRIAADMTYGRTLSTGGTLFVYALQEAVIINVTLGVFNMLPIPPLDGSRIFSIVLPEKQYFAIMKFEGLIFIVLIVLIQLPFFNNLLSSFTEHTLSALYDLTGWMKFIGL
jgi:Zn-dependent protease